MPSLSQGTRRQARMDGPDFSYAAFSVSGGDVVDDTRTEQGRVRDLYRRIRSTIGCRRLDPGGMTSAGSIFPRRRPVAATHSIPAKLNKDSRFLIL